jgi:hypothetical protein
LVFGALPRFREQGRVRDGVCLGAGFGLHLLIRPFESVFLLLALVTFFLPMGRKLATRPMLRLAGVAVLAMLPAALLTLLQNHAVTGSWTTIPEKLSQIQYGVPAALTFQANPVPQRELTPQQSMDYKMQMSFAQGPETIATYLQRLEYRIRFYRFFFLPPLYLAGLAFLGGLGEFRFAWVAVTLAIFALGTNFFPAFQFHYVAAVTCLFILVSITGLERIARWKIHGHPAGWEAAGIIVLMCCAQFLFWYGIHAADDSEFSLAARQYEVWDGLNHQNPARRVAVARELAKVPGKVLVLVHYQPQHIFQDEWVYNLADLDAVRIVWARDLGAEEDAQLLRAYPDRTVLLFEPDARPPSLSRYEHR